MMETGLINSTSTIVHETNTTVKVVSINAFKIEPESCNMPQRLVLKSIPSFEQDVGLAKSACSPTCISQTPQQPLSDQELEYLANIAQESALKKFGNSPNFATANDRLKSLPRFEFGELLLGRELGRGQFGTVSEIRSICLKRRGVLNSAKDEHQEKARRYIQDRVIRDDEIGEGDARYAVKVLQPNHTLERDTFFNYFRDMVVETHFLAALDHRNIVKLQGLCDLDSSDSYGRKCFLVTDRLYGTLEEKLAEWKCYDRKMTRRSGSISEKLLLSAHLKKRKRNFMDLRLRLLRDISSAILYLHDHRIIQRDLKPQNIGFDVRGEVKLFDFGLGTEIPCSKQDHDEEKSSLKLYNLTAKTGSIRYMAPENYKGLPYNETIDIFAFSVISWQVLTLQHLYANLNKSMIEDLVIQCDIRPDLANCPDLSERIQLLLNDMWSTKIEVRPNAKYVLSQLQNELALQEADRQLVMEEESPESVEVSLVEASKQEHMQTSTVQIQQLPNWIYPWKSSPSYKRLRRDVVDAALLSIARDLQHEFLALRRIKDRFWHLKMYPNCFLRNEAMEWLTRQLLAHYGHHIQMPLSEQKAREAAARLGNELIQAGYISHVCNDHVFDPNDMVTHVPFKFYDHLMDEDYRKCSFGSLGEKETDALQERLYLRITMETLKTSEDETMTTLTTTDNEESSPADEPIQEAGDELYYATQEDLTEPQEEEPVVQGYPILADFKEQILKEMSAPVPRSCQVVFESDIWELSKLTYKGRKMESDIDVGLLALAKDLQIEFCSFRKIKTRKQNLKKYKRVFLHNEALTWLTRRVKTHYSYHIRKHIGEDAPQWLQDNQAHRVAAELGNKLINHGYVAHVRHHYMFYPGPMKHRLFFRIYDQVLEQDSKRCSYSSLASKEKEHLQEELFLRVSMKTLLHFHEKINAAPQYISSLDVIPNPAQELDTNLDTTKKVSNECPDSDEIDKDGDVFITDLKDALLFGRQRDGNGVGLKGPLQEERKSIDSVVSQTWTKVSSRMCGEKRTAEVDIALLSVALDLKKELYHSKKIKDRVLYFKKYKSCFLHNEAMEWLIEQQVTSHLKKVRERLGMKGNELFFSDDQAEQVAARLGNELISQGYVSHVCHNHAFDQNDMETTLFFRFYDHLLEQDFESCALKRCSKHDVLKMQEDLLFRLIMESLVSSYCQCQAKDSGMQNGITSTQDAADDSHLRHLSEPHQTKSATSVTVSTLDNTSIGDQFYPFPRPKLPIGKKILLSSKSFHGFAFEHGSRSVINMLKTDSNRTREEVNVAFLSLAFFMQAAFRSATKINDRTWHQKTYRSCFLHHEALEWLNFQSKSHYETHPFYLKGKDRLHVTPPQAQIVAARIGDELIRHGYVFSACEQREFVPHDMNTLWFFRFKESVMDEDAKMCGYSSLSRDETGKLIEDLFFSMTLETLLPSKSENKRHTTKDNGVMRIQEIS